MNSIASIARLKFVSRSRCAYSIVLFAVLSLLTVQGQAHQQLPAWQWQNPLPQGNALRFVERPDRVAGEEALGRARLEAHGRLDRGGHRRPRRRAQDP